MLIQYNDTKYKIHILQLDESLSIAIKDIAGINIKAILQYIPCGDKRFDYNVVTNNYFTVAEIEEILEIITEKIYNA